MTHTSSVALPQGWTVVGQRGPGPFVTHARFQASDGAFVTWDSRRHRKLRSLLDGSRGSTWWAPGAVAWWIGVLFMIGSACFAVGSMPGYVDAVGVTADGWTFFIGSVFFTSAALAQYLEVVNVPSLPGDRAPRRGVRLLSWEPRRIDWWACTVQLVGTLCFNVSTFLALQDDLSTSQADRLVWRPDAMGSICFLVASGLAWAEVGHHWWSWRPHDLAWWIAMLNLAGSVAFGASAIASYVVPSSGEVRNVELVNLGTFVGALCFLVGAFLLLPERTRSSHTST